MLFAWYNRPEPDIHEMMIIYPTTNMIMMRMIRHDTLLSKYPSEQMAGLHVIYFSTSMSHCKWNWKEKKSHERKSETSSEEVFLSVLDIKNHFRAWI